MAIVFVLMPKLKLVQEPSGAESDLSPPPDGLLNDEQAVAGGLDGKVENQSSKRWKRAAKFRSSNTVQTEAKVETSNTANGSTPRKGIRSRAKAEVVEHEAQASDDNEAPKKAPSKKSRKQTLKAEEVTVTEPVELETEELPPKKGRRRKITKYEVKEEKEEIDENGEVVKKKTKQKRKTKEEKEAEAMPLAARTVGHKLFIGAHVSSAGGQPTNSLCTVANLLKLCRSSQHCRQRCSYRRKCFRSLLEITA